MTDHIKLSGRVRIEVKDRDGRLLRVIEKENLVVIDGFGLAAALIADESVNAISHMAAGDSSADPEEDQSDLQGTEQARTTVTTSRADHILTYTADFSGIGADVSVAEFGLFNDGSAGTMLARFTVESFTLFSGQSMDISWEIRVGQ